MVPTPAASVLPVAGRVYAAVNDVYRVDTFLGRIECGREYGSMPPEMVPSAKSSSMRLAVSPVNGCLLVEYARCVGHQDQFFSFECLCELACDQVSIDVKALLRDQRQWGRLPG